MTATISGNSLGLSTSSLEVIGGQQGTTGQPATGRAGERVYVNSTTGNLVVQNRDELLVSVGPDIGIVRTYNSQGLLDGDNNDNWRIGVYRNVALTGTANTAGSTVTRTDGDGAQTTYTFDSTRNLYVNHDGAGAFDTIEYIASPQGWKWTDGDSRVTELYNSSGRITQLSDVDGNSLTYIYNASNLISQVNDASGETTYLDYTGTSLTQIRTVMGGLTSVRTRYTYDASNRLTQITTDLSPDDASIANNNTYVVSYTYDGTSNRVATMTQTDGSSLTFTYAQVGSVWKVASITDAQNHTTTFTYVGSSTATATENVNAALLTTDATTYNLNSSAITPAGWGTTTPLASSITGDVTTFDVSGGQVAVWASGTNVYSSTFSTTTLTWSAPAILDTSNAPVTGPVELGGSDYPTVVWLQGGLLYAARYLGGTTWQTPQLISSPVSTNVALASVGAVATASSTYGTWAAANTIDNERAGSAWASGGGGWVDNTPSAFPDWLQVVFNGQKTIDRVVVYTLQDNYPSPVEPTDTMTFTAYGLTGFDVQGWNGSSWVTLATVSGNNLVKRTVTFSAFTTDRIRISATSGSGGYSRITEVEAWGVPVPPASTNVALASAGAVASASSTYGLGYPVSSVNNGERAGINWGGGTGGWADGTSNVYPDWVQIDLNGSQTIDRVVVYTVQDNYTNPVEPTDSMTFTAYGLTGFDVQGWNGSSWVTLATVTGNNLVKRTVTFNPYTTDRIRINATSSVNGYSRITEVEAWGVPAAPASTNVALASAGAAATASSTYGGGYPASSVINGERAGMYLGNGGTWNDATGNAYPDWVQINLNGSQTIDRVVVYTVQDNYTNPVEPTDSMTFTAYGLTAFDVQGWNGSSWVTLATVSGNNLVKRTVTFNAFTTDRIRVLATGGVDGFSRITEVEAWGKPAVVNYSVTNNAICWTQGSSANTFVSVLNSGTGIWGAPVEVDNAAFAGVASGVFAKQIAAGTNGDIFVTWSQIDATGATNAWVNRWLAAVGMWQGATVVSTPPGSAYLSVPGGNVNKPASIADGASNSVTGDIEVQVDFSMGDYGPTPAGAQTLARKQTNAGNQRSWQLVVLDGGTLRWASSADGASFNVVNSSTATLASVGLTPGQRALIKVTHKMNNGAGQNEVKFWYSTDGGTSWTQLGATITNSGTTSRFDSTSDLWLGDDNTAFSSTSGLKLYRFKLYSGIGGTLWQDFDPTKAAPGSTTVADAVNGAWNLGSESAIRRSAEFLNVPASNLGRPAVIADSANNSITGDIEVQVDFSMEDYGPTPGFAQTLLRKEVGGAAWDLMVWDGGALRWAASSNGSTWQYIDYSTVTLGSVGLTPGKRVQVKVTHRMNNGAGQNEVKFWYSTDGGSTWTQLGSTITHAGTFSIADTAAPLELGENTSLRSHAGIKFYRAKLFSGIGGTLKQDFNPANAAPGSPTVADGVSGAWTIGSDSSLNTSTSAQYLSVSTGNVYRPAQIADSATNSITGDIEVQVDFSMVDYGPTPGGAQGLVSKDAGGASWDLILLDGGRLRWHASSNGTSWDYMDDSTVSLSSVGLTPGKRAMVKVTHKMNNGAGQNEVKFWYSTDGGTTWNQLGSTFTHAGTYSIADTSAPLMIGENSGYRSHAGVKFYRAKLFSGIGGTLKQDFNAAYADAGSTSVQDGVNGVWTIGTDSSLAGEAPTLYAPPNNVNRPASIADSANNSITGDIEVQVDFSMVDYGPTATGAQTLARKVAGGAAWDLIVIDGGALRWSTSSNGTTWAYNDYSTVTLGSVGITAGTRALVKVTHKMNNGAGQNEVKFWYSLDGGTTWNQLGSTITHAGTYSIADTAAALDLGDDSTYKSHSGIKFYRFKLFSGIGGTLKQDFNLGNAITGSTSIADGVSGTWTIGADAYVSGSAPVSNPQIAADSSGQFVEVWTKGSDVLARAYGAGGIWNWGAPVVLDSSAAAITNLRVSQDSTGALVTWEQNGTIYATKYSSATQWAAVSTIGTGASSSGDVNSTFDAAGWISGGNAMVSTRASGGSWSTPFSLGAVTAGTFPQIHVENTFGDAVALWVSGGQLNTRYFDARSYYLVPSGATWGSIAALLYGNAAAGAQLQAALGNPALVTGAHLTNLPSTLTVGPPPYYVVQAGDSWTSIAVRLYGDRQAAAALQAATGNPALVAGLHLTIPASLSVNRTIDTHTDVTDPLGLVTTLSYDAAGELLGIQAPAIGGNRAETRYTYDANGNVTQKSDANGNTTIYTYDANGNCLTEQDAMGNSIVRTFGAKNELLTETLSSATTPAQTTRYAYDVENHLRFVVSAEGRVTEYRYNSFGDRAASIQYTGVAYPVSGLAASTSLSEAQLNTWLPADKSASIRADTTYDFRGQVSTVARYGTVDAAGNGVQDANKAVATYVYDHTGLLQIVIDGRGPSTPASDYTTTYTYDGLRRVLTSVDALGGVTLTDYLDSQRQTRITLANGLLTTYTYHPSGMLRDVVQSAGTQLGTTTFYYDADDRLRRTVDPVGIQTHTLYDEDSRIIATIDGTGSLVEYRYDPAGHVTRTIRYATLVSATALASLYDPANQGNPTAVTLAAIRPATSTDDRSSWNLYDADGHLVMSIDAAGYVTQQLYDAAGHVTDVVRFATAVSTSSWTEPPLISTVNPTSTADDRLTRNFYGPDGLLRGTLDGEGFLVEYKYDSAGQLTETVGYRNPTATSLRTTGTLAQLIPATDAGDIHTYAYYDASGRRTGDVDGEGSLTEYGYDLAGNRNLVKRYATKVTAGATLAATRPATTAEDQTTTSTFDALNRVATTLDPNGLTTTYAYDNVGNPVSTTRTAGSQIRKLTSRYDIQGRLIGELNARGSALLTGTETTAQLDALYAQYGTRYTYDLDGRRASATDANGRRTLYYYDADGRMTYSINAAGEMEFYEYDAFSALSKTTRYGSWVTTPVLVTLFGGAEDPILPYLRAAMANPLKDSIRQIFHDRRGLVSRVRDELSNDTFYGYNAFAEEVTCDKPVDTNSVRTVESFTYDRRGLQKTDKRDDGGLNLLTQTDYDAFGRATQVTQGNGFHTYGYDKAGRVLTVTDALAGTHTTTYDAIGRVLKVRDAVNAIGSETTYTYDTVNRSITTTTPEGIQMRTVRNAFGETVEVDDGRGIPTTFMYDLDGNLTDTNAPSGTIHRTFDQTGLLVDEEATNDPAHAVTHYTYSPANRMFMRVVDYSATDQSRLMLITVTTYDAKGNVFSVTDPNGSRTAYEWDLKGQLKSVTVDADGVPLKTQYDYYASGNVLRITKPNNTVTEYRYDKAGRRTQEIVDPAGLNLVTNYAYNERDQVISVTDPLGNKTRYVRDAADRARFTVNALGEVTETVYDAEGRITQVTQYTARIDASTLTNTSTPADVATKVAQAAAAAGSTVGPNSVENRVYDKDGRLRFVVNALNEVTQYQYDGNGNVVDRTTYATPITPMNLNIPNLDWAVTAIRDPARDERVRTVYDTANRAKYIVDGTGAVTKREYDFRGNVTVETSYVNRLDSGTAANYSILFENVFAGLVATANDRITINEYDNAGRLWRSTDPVGAITTRTYDRAGNVKTITHGAYSADSPLGALPVNDSTDRKETFFYDGANRLTDSVDGAGSVTHWSYDGAGNVATRTRFATAVNASNPPLNANGTLNPTASPGNDVIETFTYDKANRLSTSKVGTAVGTGVLTKYEYDGAGHEVRRAAYYIIDNGFGPGPQTDPLDRVVRHGYDAAGRMTWELDGAGTATRYLYDAKGNVVVKIAYAVAFDIDPAVILSSLPPSVSADDRRERHVYDAANREIYSVDPLGFVKRNTYDGVGNVTQTRAYATPITLPTNPVEREMTVAEVGAVQSNSATDRVDVYVYDAVGRVKSHTDAESGVESFTYDALGNKKTYTNQRNATWNYTYDRAGRLTREDSPTVEVTKLTRNGAGNLIVDTAHSGSTQLVKQYKYNGLGQLVSLTESDALSQASRATYYEYDGAGRQIRTYFPDASVYNGNAATDSTGARSDSTEHPDVRVTYDAFGHAVVNRDAAGAYSYKVYDTAGNVKLDVDALGFVTEYIRNVFGEAEHVIRYGNAISFAGLDPAQALTADTVYLRLNPTDKRIIDTQYDKAGRATRVTEPATLVYVPGSTMGQGGNIGRTTVTVYNAFGEVRFTGFQVDSTGLGAWSGTQYFYDRRGNKTTEIDSAGYATTYLYDPAGNVWEKHELAQTTTAITGTNPTSPSLLSTLPTLNFTGERFTRYAYDRLNRRVAESHVTLHYLGEDNQDHSDVSTTYGYDALGNLTRTTDATNGNTYTYYDALGRTIAVASPTRASDLAGAALQPIVEMKLDAYGNVVQRIDYAQSGTANATTYTKVASGGDRTSYNEYDAHGHLLDTIDANGQQRNYSYDKFGHVAKQWEGVTNADNVASFIVKTFEYDKLGRQTLEYDFMSAHDLVLAHKITRETRYNGYGEVVSKWTDDDGDNLANAQDEFFDYDAAGRLWRTNSGDGVTKVYLRDVAGNVTSEVRSATIDLHAAAYSTAQDVRAQLAQFERTDYKRDVMGNVVEQTQYAPSSAAVVGNYLPVATQYGLAGFQQLETQWLMFLLHEKGFSQQAWGAGTMLIRMDGDEAIFRDSAGRDHLFALSRGPLAVMREDSAIRDAIMATWPDTFVRSETALVPNDFLLFHQIETDYTVYFSTLVPVGDTRQWMEGTLVKTSASTATYTDPTGATHVLQPTDSLLKMAQDWSWVRTGWQLEYGIRWIGAAGESVDLNMVQFNVDPSGEGTLKPRWHDIGALGSGDVKVEVEYVMNGATVTPAPFIFSSEAAATGVDIKLGSSIASLTLDRVVVSKKDVTGTWQKLIDQRRGQATTVPTIISIPVPADETSSVSLRVRSTGTSEWTTVTTGVNFGDRIWFPSVPLTGTSFEYQVWITPLDGLQAMAASGTMASQMPTLSLITADISINGAGVLTWGTQAKSGFDPNEVHETLRARPDFLTYDDGAYLAYRQLERDYLQLFDNRSAFPIGWKQTNWLGYGPSSVLYLQDENTAVWEYGNTTFKFTRYDTPLEVAWRNPLIRAGWETQYNYLGLHFKYDPDGYFPNVLNHDGQQDEGLGWWQMDISFDDYFDNTTNFPVGQVWTWWTDSGGTATLQKDATGLATFKYNGVTELTFRKSDGPLKVAKQNARIRAHWASDYHITLAQAQWAIVNPATGAAHSANFGVSVRNSDMSLKYPSGRYQYELIFDAGLRPYAHAIGTVDVALSDQLVFKALGLGESESGGADNLQRIINDTQIYSAAVPPGDARAWQYSDTQSGTIIRVANDAVTGSGTTIAYIALGGVTEMQPNFATLLQTNADIRNGFSWDYRDGEHPQAISQRYVYTVAPGSSLDQAKADARDYFDLVPVGEWRQWAGGYLHKLNWNTAEFLRSNGQTFIWTRDMSMERLGDELPEVRDEWASDYGVHFNYTWRWAAWNLDLELAMTNDFDQFVDNGYGNYYLPGCAKVWFAGCSSEGLLVRGNNHNAWYVKGPVSSLPTLSNGMTAATVLDIAKNDVFWQSAWTWQYQHQGWGLHFKWVVDPSKPQVVSYTEAPSANQGTTPISLPISDPSIAPIITSSTAQPLNQETIKVTRTFDRWGNVLTESDARNSQWRMQYIYNDSNQVVEMGKYQLAAGGYAPVPGVAMNADGTLSATTGGSKFYYDQVGRTVKVSDANNNTTRLRYDKAGDLTAEIHDADSGASNLYAYNAFGDRVQKQDTLGHVTDFEYDKMDRLTVQRFAATDVYTATLGNDDSAPISPTFVGSQRREERYEYDQAGRRRKVINGAGEATKYYFDERGNVTRMTTAGGLSTVSQWDMHDHEKSEVNAKGDAQSWVYDAYGRLRSSVNLGGEAAQYSYDLAGRLTQVIKNATQVPTSAIVQKLLRAYDGFGRLAGITDVIEHTTETYSYDKAGNKVSEQLVKDGLTYQDNHLTYDALGRMTEIVDARHHVWIKYDAVGNRRRVQTNFTDDADQLRQVDNWYLYDGMNRMLVENGVHTVNNTIAATVDQGVQYTYDSEGNRISAKQKGTKYQVNGSGYEVSSTDLVTENSYYDAENRLVRSAQEADAGVSGPDNFGNLLNTTNRRMYDAAGREKANVSYNLGKSVSDADHADRRVNFYDLNGRLTRTVASGYTGTQRYWVNNVFDAASNMTGYQLNYTSTNVVELYHYEFEKHDGYRVAWSLVNRVAGPGTGSGLTLFEYDANGHVKRIRNKTSGSTIADDPTDFTATDNPDAVKKNRIFVNTSEGAVLARVDGMSYGTDSYIPVTPENATVNSSTTRIRHSLVVDGQTLGVSAKAVGSDPYLARFDFGAQNAGNVGESPSLYILSASDQALGLASLKHVAQLAYGDATLWFVIAEANGLYKNADVKAGMTISLPSNVTTNKNDGRTFKPYDSSEIRGDNSPVLPRPQGGDDGCGVMGTIIVAIVAIVVTVLTEGATAEWAAEALGEAAAEYATAIEIGSAAVGAAAGNLAGQVVANALGMQDGISWRSVASAAVSAGFTQGLLGPAGPGMSGAQAAARAAISSAINQGVNVAMGLQKSFSWTAVAASAIAAPLAQSLSNSVANGAYAAGASPQVANIMGNFAYGLTTQVAVKAATGGKIKWENITADAFGNALGQSLAGTIAAGNQREDYWLDANTRVSPTRPNDSGDEMFRELVSNLADVYSQPRVPGSYDDMYAMDAERRVARDAGVQAPWFDPRRSFGTQGDGAAFGNPNLGAAVGNPDAIKRVNERAEAFVAGAEDYWVDEGGLGGYLGYLGAKFVPRSVEGWAAFIASGPVIGEAAAVGLPALLRVAPFLGRELSTFGSATDTMATGAGRTFELADRAPVGGSVQSFSASVSAADRELGFVFRGDSRSPEVIFDQGFRARGTSDHLLRYAETNEPSAFVGTTKSPTVAREDFASTGDFVYTIRGRADGLDVNAILGPKSPYPYELEVVFKGGIPASNILGARQVGPGGVFVGPFIRNPAYVPR